MHLVARGRRLMTAGSVGLLIIAALHTVAHFSPLPDEPSLNSTVKSMEECRVEAGFGMKPSIADLQRAMSLTMSMLLATLGAADLLIIGHSAVPAGLLRRLGILNLAAMAALVALYLAHSFPPPAIMFGFVAAIFLVSVSLPTLKPVSSPTPT